MNTITRAVPLPAILAVVLLGVLPPVATGGSDSASPGHSSFVDRVWRVAESAQVEEGSVRVFLSEGILVMASAHAEPAFGSWSYDSGRLTITEEGLTYEVEIVALTEQEFRIRIHGPGEPIDIRFEPARLAGLPAPAEEWVELSNEPGEGAHRMRITGTVHHLDLEGGVWVIRTEDGTNLNPTALPAEYRVEGLAVEAEAVPRDDLVSIGMVGPLVELVRIRRRGDDATGGDDPGGLLGTQWRLEDLGGRGVIDRVQATLEFPAAGRAAGNASCNRFFGAVEVSGSSISFGELATTRMACPEAVSEQERRYLAALESAGRYEIQEPFLYVYSPGLEKPLRLIREDP